MRGGKQQETLQQLKRDLLKPFKVAFLVARFPLTFISPSQLNAHFSWRFLKAIKNINLFWGNEEDL